MPHLIVRTRSGALILARRMARNPARVNFFTALRSPAVYSAYHTSTLVRLMPILQALVGLLLVYTLLHLSFYYLRRVLLKNLTNLSTVTSLLTWRQPNLSVP
jgi:hypothetical protein